MVFTTFNLIFFILLIALSRLTPKKLVSLLYVLAGIIFLYKYSFICLLLWIGVSLILIFHYGFKEYWIRTMGWLASILLLIIAFKLEINLKPTFSFEIMLLFIYNLARAWSLYRSFPAFSNKSPKINDIISYLWFPPILFSGPIERFEEFQKMHHGKKTVCFYSVTKYLLSAISNGIAAFVLIKIFNPLLFDFNKATLVYLLIYLVQASLLVAFQFIAWIHLVRAVCHMMGYNFSRPNFQKFLTAGGLIEFWISWNMSFTKFVRDYVFFPKNRIPTTKEFLARLVLAFTIYGPMHGISPNFFLWGLLQATGLIIQSSYRILRRRVYLFQVFEIAFPHILKIAITLSWLVITTPLLLPEGSTLYTNLWIKISDLIPAAIEIATNLLNSDW